MAGQTAVYGISSIVGRILNYLLVPLYTYTLATGAYGVVTEMYAYVALLVVILTYGMETAFFRYSEIEKDKKAVFSTTMISLLITSSFFVMTTSIFSHEIAGFINYPNHNEYIIWFGLIIALDAISCIPLAFLRAQNKAKRFVFIKIINISINLGLNIFFILLCPFLLKHNIFSPIVELVFDGEISVKYIFISNLIASAAQVILLFPEIFGVKYKFDKALWKRMMIYALPLLIFGLAGTINEALDRILLKYLLPENAMSQLGIYGAVYKISIIMTIFIQAFRYAAEPFFFAQAANKDAKKLYADVMNWFVIAASIIFLGTMLYLEDVIIFYIGSNFREGAYVIPILLMANLFLGIYYNLSIWYKLTDKTMWGAYISIFGAIITIALNIYWIPRIGYLGSAWATFICYGSMMLVSYFMGQKHYNVDYNLKKVFGYIGFSVVLYLISTLLPFNTALYRVPANSLLFIIFLASIFYFEKKNFKKDILHA